MRRIAVRAGFALLFGVTSVTLCAGQTLATVQYKDLPGVALYANGYLLSSGEIRPECDRRGFLYARRNDRQRRRVREDL